MQIYIALLRGINVSGQKKIKMVDLKASFKGLGFTDVVTYIQSGNIVFKSVKTDKKTLEKTIHHMLLNEFGFDVNVVVLTPKEIRYTANNNPFEKDVTKEHKKFYIVFLQDEPQPENIEKLKEYDYSPEEYLLEGKIIYFYAANGAGNAKMNNNFFENKLKVKATSRNWRTTNKLLEIVKLLD